MPLEDLFLFSYLFIRGIEGHDGGVGDGGVGDGGLFWSKSRSNSRKLLSAAAEFLGNSVNLI